LSVKSFHKIGGVGRRREQFGTVFAGWRFYGRKYRKLEGIDNLDNLEVLDNLDGLDGLDYIVSMENLGVLGNPKCLRRAVLR